MSTNVTLVEVRLSNVRAAKQVFREWGNILMIFTAPSKRSICLYVTDQYLTDLDVVAK